MTPRLTFEDQIRALLKRGTFPGISILAARGEEILLNKAYGHRCVAPASEPLDEPAIYDLASLTKPLITAFLALYLVERENLSLDTPVKKILPDFPDSLTPLHLLTHTSGLPGWYPFYLFKRDYLQQLQTMKLEARPGARINYSCPGYILLFHVLQKAAGIDFPSLARQVIFQPLGLKHTFFKVPENQMDATAPTEKGNIYEKELAEKNFIEASRIFPWRSEMIRGEAHDANSFYLGGTAGNAGLFSNTTDLFRLSQEFFPETATILKPETTRLFWRNQTPRKASHRTIGFKMNSSLITSGGRAFSRDAIGHSGFTGTSLWLEPGSLTVFIMLTNRIHPMFKPINFNRIRRKLHRIIRSDLGM